MRMACWAVEFGDNFEQNELIVDKITDKLVDCRASTSNYHIAVRSLSQVFLPDGFPDSVQPEYLEYQFFDTLQALSSYLRGIFTTKALLSGLGVGDDSATALAAALTWVFRDGVGMTGSLFFSFYFGSTFDSHLKEWRLFADISNDIGLTLDLAAPLFPPSCFFPIISLATLFKAFCGVAAGSTKASITSHMALKGNTADVAAKEGAQETLVTLLGMVLGVFCAHFVGDNLIVMWVIFSLLTALHVYANWRGVCALRLVTFNRHRFSTAVWCHRRMQCGDSSVKQIDPAYISKIDSSVSVWLQLATRVKQELRIEMGVRMSRLCFTGLFTCSDVDRLRSEQCYLITCHPTFKIVRVAFTSIDMTPIQELRCFLHAQLVLEYIDSSTKGNSESLCDFVVRVVAETSAQCDREWAELREHVLGHWDLRKVSLGSRCWRYNFVDPVDDSKKKK